MRVTWCLRGMFVAAAMWASVCAAVAAPPTIDLSPSLGHALIMGRWQPVTVTLASPPTGETLTGEIQVTVDNPRSGEAPAVFARPVTLPAGAGATRTTLLVYIPSHSQAELTVALLRGRDGAGETVTRRTFDKIPVRPEPLAVVAVSNTPDALDYLNGARLGVVHTDGVLRPVPPPYNPVTNRTQNQEPTVSVGHTADGAGLPDRAIGYDGVGIVYLGADVRADTFSDAQVAALRGWVVGGGVLVNAAPRLRDDERFREWVPALAPAGQSGARAGRGTVVLPALDPAAPDYAARATALAYWRSVAHAGITGRGMALALTSEGTNNYYYGSNQYQRYNYGAFFGAILHSLNLRGPGLTTVGGFLIGYLLLLVPINYLVLKRMGRREWGWATTPALVMLFSLGAYGFGFATKGTQMFQNTATIVEMGEGSGEATVCGAIGLFSPARSRYDVALAAPADAVLWTPSTYGTAQTGGGGNFLLTQDAQGATAHRADISMWAMRTFATRTSQLRMGNGVKVTLKRQGRQLVGAISNQTGHALNDVTVHLPGRYAKATNIPTLAPGQTVSFSETVWAVPGGDTSYELSLGGKAYLGNRSDNTTPPREAITQSIAQTAETFYQADRGEILVTGWNNDPLLPVTVDGHAPRHEADVNLFVVHVPLPPAAATGQRVQHP